MRKRAIHALLAAALCAGLALSARAADDGDKPAAPSGVSAWWNNLFGAKEESADKEKKKIEPVEKPLEVSLAEREALRRRERAALCRRLEVIDRLKQVAQQNNDPGLESRIVEAEEEAFSLCRERMAAIDQLDEPPPPKEKAKKSGISASGSKKSNGGDEP